MNTKQAKHIPLEEILQCLGYEPAWKKPHKGKIGNRNSLSSENMAYFASLVFTIHRLPSTVYCLPSTGFGPTDHLNDYDFMQELLKHYDLETAKQKNRSFHYLFQKRCFFGEQT